MRCLKVYMYVFCELIIGLTTTARSTEPVSSGTRERTARASRQFVTIAIMKDTLKMVKCSMKRHTLSPTPLVTFTMSLKHITERYVIHVTHTHTHTHTNTHTHKHTHIYIISIYIIQFLHADSISLTPPRARHPTPRKLL